ncbi:MAG: anti-sigma factor domain-containing protein [Actinomycetota bacterium]
MSDIHESVRSLVAAYAIGAVPEEEIPPIRAHILTCEECFEEAESFAQIAMALTEAAEPVELSAGFTERLLKAVRGDEELEIATREPSRGWFARSRTMLLAGATVVLVAMLVFTTASYLGSVARQRQYESAVAALINDPDALKLHGPGGAEAVLASTSEGSVLVAVDLGEAPAGRDYQLWLMKDGDPTPADTFDVSGGVVIIESARGLSGYDGAAVTVEPEGGSSAPTTEPVLTSGDNRQGLSGASMKTCPHHHGQKTCLA